jgi:hypothetical protein
MMGSLLPVGSHHRDGPNLPADIGQQGNPGSKDPIIIADEDVHSGTA